jgi:hypothetical protein
MSVKKIINFSLDGPPPTRKSGPAGCTCKDTKNLPTTVRGEWGYLDRFFSCRAFPNHPIYKINVLLYLSHIFISPVFFILFQRR